MILVLFQTLTLIGNGVSLVSYFENSISDVAVGLSEIINGLQPTQLAIFTENKSRSDVVDDFIYQTHKNYYKTMIFYDKDIYFEFIKDSIKGSIKSYSLIFGEPYNLSVVLQKQNLAHRLSLFIFYWGALEPPQDSEVRFEEPMRAVVITRPRLKAVYYNQAVPIGISNLKLVNWYDANSLGLYKTPLLPTSASVYSNFEGRIFKVPVFHSPPWYFVNYDNETANTSDVSADNNENHTDTYEDSEEFEDQHEVNVTGGRDHKLLSLLGKRMNFKFIYVDPPGRIQGSMTVDNAKNYSFTGGIGMLQNRRAHFLLGDVSLSWERRKAIEYSFFTLADSGAFVTHAPRRLNEALAILRPFKLDVWPYLILTILLSGPAFYFIIAIPYLMKFNQNESFRILYPEYINEISLVKMKKSIEIQHEKKIPKGLFGRCVWFSLKLFLKQSCSEPYHGYRARFLVIVYWIAATYVLADVYSAQLTSQFARPAREAPINTLQKLQKAMKVDGYKLYVEKGSISLEMLENGTEIFRNLFILMKHQHGTEGYLIDSVEAGVQFILYGSDNLAVLGGRETLDFNTRQFGVKNFQLSYKLYTRYSAVAVQIGCPFLDSLNDVLMHLFEGGILDKITNEEYENMSQNTKKQNDASIEKKPSQPKGDGSEPNQNDKLLTNKSSDSDIQPLNIRMLQGAFIILFVGYALAGIILVMEQIYSQTKFFWVANIRNKLIIVVYTIFGFLKVLANKTYVILKIIVLKILKSIFKAK